MRIRKSQNRIATVDLGVSLENPVGNVSPRPANLIIERKHSNQRFQKIRLGESPGTEPRPPSMPIQQQEFNGTAILASSRSPRNAEKEK